MPVRGLGGPLQAFQDGAHKLVGISHEITFHHVAATDVTFRDIHPAILDDDIDIGFDPGLAAVLVVEVRNLAGDDDQATFIQDGQLRVDLNPGVRFFDDRAFGNEAKAALGEFFEGGVDLGQDLLFFLEGNLVVLVNVGGGELFGLDRGFLRPTRENPGDETENQERKRGDDFYGHGSGNLVLSQKSL